MSHMVRARGAGLVSLRALANGLPRVVYAAAPAQIKLDTTMVVLKPKSLEAYITITNAGVTTLVVSSIAQVCRWQIGGHTRCCWM